VPPDDTKGDFQLKTDLQLRYPGALLLALGVSTFCHAQTVTGTMSRVTIIHVKPDMVNEWRELERSYVPDLKKGGQKSRTVYQTSIFGNNYEYVIVAPIDHFADFDGQSPMAKALEPAALLRRNAMLVKCIESSTSFMSTRLDEISNLAQSDAIPPILVVARYRIAPGKLQEFINLMKSDVLPVYKKAGVRMTVMQRGPGTNPNDVTVGTFFKTFAEWGGQPFLTKQLGADGAAKINAKFTGVRTLIEVVTRKRVDELSF
jgi:hypothetical protein